MRLLEDIESYLKAMQEIQESINELKGERFLENHKQTLFFSLIESISKGIFGDKYIMNYTKFEKFIIEFCEWEDANRISLQQLALLLEKTEDHEYLNLKKYVFSHLMKYPESTPVPFNYDPTVEVIKQLMPKGETAIYGVDIYSFIHVNLLWKYRNSLVHEARSLGSIGLFDFVEYPHYVHYTKLMPEGERDWEVWKISYPTKFFNNLVETALVNVKEKLIEKEQDPRGNYDFEELWIKPKKK